MSVVERLGGRVSTTLVTRSVFGDGVLIMKKDEREYKLLLLLPSSG